MHGFWRADFAQWYSTNGFRHICQGIGTSLSTLLSDHCVETRICCRANEFSIACRQEIISTPSNPMLDSSQEQITTLLDLGPFYQRLKIQFSVLIDSEIAQRYWQQKTNIFGKTPLDGAKRRGHEDIVKLLSQY